MAINAAAYPLASIDRLYLVAKPALYATRSMVEASEALLHLSVICFLTVDVGKPS